MMWPNARSAAATRACANLKRCRGSLRGELGNESYLNRTMQDVTEDILRYREASRLLWNVFFRPIYQLEIEEDFADADRALLQGLVLRYHGIEGTTSIQDLIHVVPTIHKLPIMISNPRAGDRNGYWDHPIEELEKDQFEAGFIEFFDFRAMDGPLNHQYARCRLFSCSKHPDLVGRDALIEVLHISFFWMHGGA